MNAATIVLAALLGALTWSLMEYCIHRWLGHDRRFAGNLFEKEHTAHHSRGNWFAATWKKAGAAVLTGVLVGVPSVWLLGPVIGGAYTGGLVAFYLCYEALHRLEHVHAGFNAYGRWARRHHFFHHYEDPRCNHGVTSPLWDIVFGTLRKPGVVRVPEKLAPLWLIDPATGDVFEQFAQWYQLRASKRSLQQAA